MREEDLEEMIRSLNLEEQIDYDSIPNLELYMDQVITIFNNCLGHTKRYESDKLLTKTMINNYIKDKLLMPATKKKYTREHVVLIILLYELKQILTIGDIKDIFSMIIKEQKVDEALLKDVYGMYLEAKKVNTASFKEEALAISNYVGHQIQQLKINEQEEDMEKLGNMMEIILLTQKAGYYKRLAEKMIDTHCFSK